jgi:type VI protein secretion system component Hcp
VWHHPDASTLRVLAGFKVTASSYYLLIDGLNGGSLSDAYSGAFEIDSFSLDIEAVPASGGGGGAGRVEFGPLVVKLDLGSALAALAETAAEGRFISSLRLVGVTDTGAEVYDLRLGDVRITRFADAGRGPDRLAFSYDEIELTTRTMRNDGSLGRRETFGWDLSRNAPGDGVPEPEPAGGRASGGQALEHYLLIDGLNGGSRADAYRGAFEIDSYSFDIEAVLASGGGGGAGRTEFGPLVVKLDIGSAQAALAETAAAGRFISSLRLVGVTDTGGEVYDLRLGDVRISRLIDAGRGSDRLAFSYEEIELTTRPVRSDGGLGRRETFGWDISRNAASDGVPEPDPAGGRASGGQALEHYLLIDGLSGGSLSDEYSGAFEIEGYSLDIEAASSSGGGGAGRVSFGPLVVELEIGSALPALAETAASGRFIPSLQLVGVTVTGAEVYDLRLGEVQITRLADAGPGPDLLEFSYDEIELTTRPVRSDGSPGRRETFSWDLSRNAPGESVPEPDPESAARTAIEGAEAFDDILVLMRAAGAGSDPVELDPADLFAGRDAGGGLFAGADELL